MQGLSKRLLVASLHLGPLEPSGHDRSRRSLSLDRKETAEAQADSHPSQASSSPPHSRLQSPLTARSSPSQSPSLDTPTSLQIPPPSLRTGATLDLPVSRPGRSPRRASDQPWQPDCRPTPPVPSRPQSACRRWSPPEGTASRTTCGWSAPTGPAAWRTWRRPRRLTAARTARRTEASPPVGTPGGFSAVGDGNRTAGHVGSQI